MADTDREFPNPYLDFSSSSSVHLIQNGKISNDYKGKILENLMNLLQTFEDNLPKEKELQSDNSVYTGTAGFSLLYLHLHSVLNEKYLEAATLHCSLATSNLKNRRISFLCGDAGPLALGAIIHKKNGNEPKSQDFINRLQALSRQVIPLNTDLPDELLYGRVGYLYALLFVQHHLGKSSIQEDIIAKVIDSILTSGQQLSNSEKMTNCPLFYKWHEKPYIGAAHGIVGIIYVLLLCREYLTKRQLESLVLPTVNYIASLKYKSGNYPSSLGNSTDKLIHWCHGAPGVIHLLALSYEVFKDESHLKLSRECADVIWQRGLLKKGYGLCHGVAGNGYAFLRMFQLTNEYQYLYRAIKFCEWCFDYGKHGCRIADRPLSLFEGLAGTIYFIADMLKPEQSAFPAFQL